VGAIAKIEPGTVRKSVGAIHVIAEHTLLERKIFNFLLKHAYPELRTSNRHRISVLELARGVGTTTNNMDAIKEAILGLMSKPVEWNALADGEHEWAATTGLASAKVSRGICTYEYSTVLVERLADPEVYSLIDLRVQQQFNSRYALNLYENCQRFLAVGSTGWWDLDLFRRMLGATAEHHNEFKYLRRDVIEVAMKEINEVSDIEVAVEYHKVGRSISALRFKVKASRRGRLLLEEPMEQERRKAAYQDLTALGMSDKAALKAIKCYDEGYLLEKITLTRRLVKSGKVNDAGAFLAAAIRDDYALAPEVGQVDPELLAALQARKASDSAEDIETERRIAEEKAQRRQLVAAIDKALKAMPEAERRETEKAFVKSLTTVHRQLFEAQGYGVLPMARLQEFVLELAEEPQRLAS